MVQLLLPEEPHEKILNHSLPTHTHTACPPNPPSPRPPSTLYVGLEGSSYGSRRGAAGLLLGHGRLIHGKTLFQRHLLAWLVLHAWLLVLGLSWARSVSAACRWKRHK